MYCKLVLLTTCTVNQFYVYYYSTPVCLSQYIPLNCNVCPLIIPQIDFKQVYNTDVHKTSLQNMSTQNLFTV